MTAAFLLGYIDWAPNTVDVTVSRKRNPVPCRNVVVHRATSLEESDVIRIRGLRVTSPARTLLDLAAGADEIELRRMTEVAIARHRLGVDYLLGRCAAHRRAPGMAKLRRVLLSMVSPAELRSKLERRFRSHWERAGHPPYIANAIVQGIEVDGLWVELGLVLEIDVYETHGAESRYRNDRRRGRILALAGLELIRLAGEDYGADPDGVVAELAVIVAARARDRRNSGADS